VYDLAQDEQRRLTEGTDQEVVLGWSPNCEWIGYSEAYAFEFVARPGYVDREFLELDSYRLGYVA